MAFECVLLTKVTIAIWSHPVTSDHQILLERLKATYEKYGNDCGFISLTPAEIVLPDAAYMKSVPIHEILRFAPHSAAIIEGTGMSQSLARALHSSLFTVTRLAGHIAVVQTLDEAFERLASSVGVDRSLWSVEAREIPILAQRLGSPANRGAFPPSKRV